MLLRFINEKNLYSLFSDLSHTLLRFIIYKTIKQKSDANNYNGVFQCPIICPFTPSINYVKWPLSGQSTVLSFAPSSKWAHLRNTSLILWCISGDADTIYVNNNVYLIIISLGDNKIDDCLDLRVWKIKTTHILLV